MKVPLLEYLDKLEATAKAASDGRWTEVNDWNSTSPNAPIDTIETIRAPRNAGERSSWGIEVHVQIATVGPDHDNPEADRAHILATQPKATLALIAKLREAVQLARGLENSAIEFMRHRVPPGSVESVRAEIDALFEIEVPE